MVDIALPSPICPNPAGEFNGLLMKKDGCCLMQMVANHLQAHESVAVIVTCYSGLVSIHVCKNFVYQEEIKTFFFPEI